MKLINNRKPYRNKRSAFLSIAIVFIILGAGLFVVNAYQYAKGYFAYKTISTDEESDLFSTQVDNPTKVNTQLDRYDILSKMKQKEQNLYPTRPETGDEIGELYIPKLKAVLPVFEGTEDKELDKGVGHFAESVLPGEIDNCVLSGHRDTVFRKLGDIGKGDLLIVKTTAGEFQYKVAKVRIVDANDRTVIVPKPRATLTVSTCYPFDYIGSAPKRYILVAYRVLN